MSSWAVSICFIVVSLVTVYPPMVPVPVHVTIESSIYASFLSIEQMPKVETNTLDAFVS